MDIIYTKYGRQYRGNNFPEGPYRLEDIARIGRNIEADIDFSDSLRTIHSDSHIAEVESAGDQSRMLAEVPADKYTYPAVLNSATLALSAARNGHFGCTRPPGHHATGDVAKGFCFFNNMAIAVQSLLNEGKRVCILDIDGHQGDGTEQIFYASDQVLFCSIHQEFAYPYFYLGMNPSAGYDVTVDRRGKDHGEGFTWNLPVPKNAGDDIWLDFVREFTSTIEEFSPDIIGISAGFDGYHADALLNLNYTQAGYYEFGRIIHDLGIQSFALLEGGYHNDVVACIEALVTGINGEDYTPDDELSTSSKGIFGRYKEYYERLEI